MDRRLLGPTISFGGTLRITKKSTLLDLTSYRSDFNSDVLDTHTHTHAHYYF